MKQIKNLKRIILFVLVSFLLKTNLFSQSIIYVKADATGNNDGTSWVNAYTDLRTALSNAVANDTIWVASGTYKPTNGTDRGVAFLLKKHVPVYGGFAGTETNLNERDWQNNITTLSGNIGNTSDETDNSYNVVWGEDSTRLDGFVISDGYAESPSANGGGMYNQTGDELIIANCTFENNKASGKGNAMYNNFANVTIYNCTFSYNGDNSYNGGNSSAEGGAIYNLYSEITIDKCDFHNNTSSTNGGAIYNTGETIIISNSNFSGNNAEGKGGGIYTDRYCKIYNTAITRNLSHTTGGGIYSTVGDSIINCTFANNFSEQPGANVADENTASVIINSILVFGNANPSTDGFDYWNLAGNPHKITYSCYTGYENLSGTGNIQYAYPDIFVDFSYNDFHLRATSPCIDAANGDYATTVDKDGLPRHDDFTVANIGTGTPAYVDMGAYEFQHNSPMHGVYTIGTTGDFHSFSEAVDSLISLGISDDVIFNVQSGTYNEQVLLPEIAGLSSNNTITFQSETGDSTDVVLTYASQDANSNYTLKIQKADYVTFRGITLQATGTNYARVIVLDSAACHNTFSNNRIIGVVNSSELVYCGYQSDTSITFEFNRFENGTIGVRFSLSAYNTSNYGNEIKNNYFYNQSDKAVYINSSNNSRITSNTFYSDFTSTAIYVDEISNADTISNNKIQLNAGGTGIYFIFCDNGNLDTSIISNNFIYLNTINADKGIYIRETKTPVKVFYNTVRILGNNTGSYAIYFDWGGISNRYALVQNNIFSNEANGQAAYFYGSIANSDYNDYFSTGQFLIEDRDFESWKDLMLQFNNNKDLHSINVKPYFVTDTTYQAQNLALAGAGIPVAGFNYDIEGDQRSATTPCIGADEFTVNTTPMHGVYTIAASSADYASINDAVDDLYKRGVDGAVVFSIAPGTYNEQIKIQEVQGVSAANNITFQSATGDSTDVIIRFLPQFDYKNYTIAVEHISNINFKHLTIRSDTVIGIPVNIRYDANFITISNSVLTTVGYSKPLVQFGVDDYLGYLNYKDSNNVFKNCFFENGRYAIYNKTDQYHDVPKNTFIISNNFRNCGVVLYGARSSFINANTFNISNLDFTFVTAIYTSNDNDTVINNMIYMYDSLSNHNYSGIYGKGLLAYNTVKIIGGNDCLSMYAWANSTVENNVLIAYKALHIDTAGSSLDYNVYYGMINNYTYQYWQDHTNLDAHSIYYNPVFVSDTNLHTNDSWLNNRGVPIAGVTTDIDGEIRNTSTPDIGADEFNGSSPLSGVYTIGATGHFPDFANAVDSMNILGVADSVIFKVQPGTYNNQIYLADSNIIRIPDTSAIVFESLSGDSTDVVLQNSNTAANNYVIYLDSISYVNINHLTIRALDTANAVVIKTRSSSNNVIANNVLEGNGNISPVIYSANGVDNNNIISDNLINNGKYGIVFIGESTQKESGNQFISNILQNQYSGGIEVKYQSMQQILSNNIVRSNPVEDTTWVGIGIINSGGNWDERAITANNMVSFNATGKSAGIHLYGSPYNNIFFNSVNIFGDSAVESRDFNIEGSTSYIHVKNNIFYNTAKGLVYYNVPPTDYNDVYTNGDNFAYHNGFIADFTSWVSTTNQDQNSVSFNPLFVSDTDLHINQPQLIGAGTYVAGVYTDYDGETRDTLLPTIGADKISVNCNGPLAGEYTVGSGGDFASFNDLLFKLYSCGVADSLIFKILPGTYNEQVLINGNQIQYINGVKPITFISASNNADDVILTYDADSANNYIFKIKNIDSLSIKSLTFQSVDTSFARLITFEGSVKSCTIEGCSLFGANTNSNNDQCANIYSKAIDYHVDTLTLNIINNYIENGSSGINLIDYMHFDFNIRGNTFINQKYASAYFDNHETSNDLNCIFFTKNTINNNNNPRYGFYSCYIDSSMIIGNRINIVTNTLCYAIENYSRENVIANNFISMKAIDNAFVCGYSSTWQSKLYYNSILLYGTGHYNSNIIYLTSNAPQNIYNNNFINLISGNIIYNYYGYNNVNSDYNNLYSTSGGFSLSNWQNTSGLDSNSVSFMPDFVSFSDLHTNSALLYQKGTAIPQVTDDIDGETRNNPPCIGADEFTSPVFNAGNDTIFCFFSDEYGHTSTHTYNIGTGYDTYQWSNGSDSSSIQIDTTNTQPNNNVYYVTVTVSGNTYSDSVNIFYDKPIPITQTDYCYWNSPITIEANPGFETYEWGTGDTTDYIVATHGNFSTNLVVTDNYGCYGIENIHIDWAYNYGADYNYPANFSVSDTSICSDDSLVLFANQYTDSDVYDHFIYEWNTGDTTQTLLIDSNTFVPGSYALVATVILEANQLCASTDTVNVTITDCPGVVNQSGNFNVSVFPNPVHNKIIIDGTRPDYYQIVSSAGELIMTGNIKATPKMIDVSSVPSGVYFIKLRVGNDFVIKKLVIK